MSDTVPYLFFFSYARVNRDAYLLRFFDDLKEMVTSLEGAHDANAVGFRDEVCVKTGDEWNSKICAALQNSKVLVCVYTPSYFAEDKDHEFCAKEFAAFLKRNPQIRYEPTLCPDGKARYQVREARNILPVLWFGEQDLLKKLPPHVVQSIDYTIQIEGEKPHRASEIATEYLQKGMRDIARRRRDSGTLNAIITHFARRIIGAEALPSDDPPPTFDDLWNAFWEPPDHPDERGTPDSPERLVAPSDEPLRGPGDVLGIQVRAESNNAMDWIPYVGEPPLATAVQEIIHERRLSFHHMKLDPSAHDFEHDAWSLLEHATAKQATPILFVDPECLRVQEQRSPIIRLLQREWCGGVIIPVDHSDRTTVRLIEDTLPGLGISGTQRERIIVRPSIGTIADFRTRVDSVLGAILAGISKTGTVQQKPPQNDGPDSAPSVTNIGTAVSVTI